MTALCLGASAASAAGEHAGEAGTFNLLLENDAFAATDHHYTNGLEISYLTAPRSRGSIAFRLAEMLPGNDHGQVRVGWQFGQTIFTPNNKDARDLVPEQRPYAAWLYGGASIVYSGRGHIDTWSLLLGTVGPNAQGEALQSAVHDWLGNNESRGWKNQIGNRIGGMLVVERKWRALALTGVALGADLMPHVGISLGNVASYANAGFTLRFGNGLGTDFGPPQIRPSLPGSGLFEPRGEWAWYLFAGVDGRMVERNIFVDDNDLEPLLAIEKQPWVTDVQAGVVLTRGDFRMSCMFVHRSEEFDTQLEPDRFGSLAFTWRF
ncbi:MAG TPA: lipid A deacylase LpxR family protein [Woeseiaceae bacterium]|nr:lipid A deacylase LpxR family protein [Woeseiaceae bacterium]